MLNGILWTTRRLPLELAILTLTPLWTCMELCLAWKQSLTFEKFSMLFLAGKLGFPTHRCSLLIATRGPLTMV